MPQDRKSFHSACLCENSVHFETDTAHPYQAEVATQQIIKVWTEYGTLPVCPCCALSCMAPLMSTHQYEEVQLLTLQRAGLHS